MEITWIILPVLFVGITGVFFYIFRKNKKKIEGDLKLHSDHEEDFKRATPAIGQIMSVNTGHALRDARGQIKVDLRFEITASGCAMPYYGTSSWLVESINIPNLQQGSIVQVRVDPENNKKVYPDVPWAKYWVY